MDSNHDPETDEILGITRCVECGHRLDGQVECPFCSAVRGMDTFRDDRPRHSMPLWVLLTAMLLTFPLSLPWIFSSNRLNMLQKIVTLIVSFLWGGGIYLVLF